MRTCRGEKRQNSRKLRGKGSQTETSHTSRVGSGCERLAAVAVGIMEVTKRRGEEDGGEESTRTRWAEGVLGTSSIGFSKRR
jgi:hypothetical protein